MVRRPLVLSENYLFYFENCFLLIVAGESCNLIGSCRDFQQDFTIESMIIALGLQLFLHASRYTACLLQELVFYRSGCYGVRSRSFRVLGWLSRKTMI